ncbi:uncharacterized protein MCYG_02217 [Microsporum canis CBS 113480]|uniref:Uncharacterized protein n=1 Tax=Arthroderma otae (strain ATCC MYA-4605 / CBS 113480) TaxID=554155 RepID=C5FJ68_ARTOC|nr:uncharacterized protein MCYG_02217 [Microsporum canis CBS 113480]EEQ29398.1 hypothetical protein MCYG_02217 [Microsporum canis CBS 113480]
MAKNEEEKGGKKGKKGKKDCLNGSAQNYDLRHLNLCRVPAGLGNLHTDAYLSAKVHSCSTTEGEQEQRLKIAQEQPTLMWAPTGFCAASLRNCSQVLPITYKLCLDNPTTRYLWISVFKWSSRSFNLQFNSRAWHQRNLATLFELHFDQGTYLSSGFILLRSLTYKMRFDSLVYLSFVGLAASAAINLRGVGDNAHLNHRRQPQLGGVGGLLGALGGLGGTLGGQPPTANSALDGASDLDALNALEKNRSPSPTGMASETEAAPMGSGSPDSLATGASQVAVASPTPESAPMPNSPEASQSASKPMPSMSPSGQRDDETQPMTPQDQSQPMGGTQNSMAEDPRQSATMGDETTQRQNMVKQPEQPETVGNEAEPMPESQGESAPMPTTSAEPVANGPSPQESGMPGRQPRPSTPQNEKMASQQSVSPAAANTASAANDPTPTPSSLSLLDIINSDDDRQLEGQALDSLKGSEKSSLPASAASGQPTPDSASPMASVAAVSGQPTPASVSPMASVAAVSGQPTPASVSPNASGAAVSGQPTPASASPSSQDTVAPESMEEQNKEVIRGIREAPFFFIVSIRNATVLPVSFSKLLILSFLSRRWNNPKTTFSFIREDEHLACHSLPCYSYLYASVSFHTELVRTNTVVNSMQRDLIHRMHR